MEIALVHDYLNQRGGAEKVLQNLVELFPTAPVYTLIYSPEAMGSEYRSTDIRTSLLQKMPLSRKHYDKYLPFYPLFIEQFDLGEYDLVISDSSAWAKGVVTPPSTCHVSYFHTPMRFAWDHRLIATSNRFFVTRAALELTLNYLRLWDVISTKRVDYIACNSTEISDRIRKYYDRGCTVIHPPVDTEFYTPYDNGAGGDKRIRSKYPDGYFLAVGRIKPYKKIDLAVEAFRGLKEKLVVIGDGKDRDVLQESAPPNVDFYGYLPDDEVREYYRNCKAFIMTAYEDFGISAVEAMACGRPVIAYARGGARDTVIPGVTGLWFDEQNADSVRAAVRSFNATVFDTQTIRYHAERFGKARFKKEIYDFAMDSYEKYRTRNGARLRPEPVKISTFAGEAAFAST